MVERQPTAYERVRLIGDLEGAVEALKDYAKAYPAREIDLALTNAQQALLWARESPDAVEENW